MVVMSKRVMPVCDTLCTCCPAMRTRSRHPVKRYKNMLAECGIWRKNLMTEKSDCVNMLPKTPYACPRYRRLQKRSCGFQSQPPSELPFKDMANQCESLQIAKQQLISNITSAQLFQEIAATFTNQAPSSEIVAMSCSAEVQHHLYFLPLPTSSPHDNFLKAAGS